MILFNFFSDVHWSLNCVAVGTIGSLESFFAIYILSNDICLPESGLERFYIVLQGILSIFGQIGLTMAAIFESAANIGLLRKAFDVILAFIFQIAFFRVRSNIFFP